MKIRSAVRAAALLAASGVAASASGASAADAIKPGRWEFTSQMQAPAMPQLPPGTQLPPGVQMPQGGGMNVTRTSCIDPDRAIPTDPRPECRVDQMQRNGSVINWSTTCNTPQGAVRSSGAARYSGDTMEATMTTQIPQPGGPFMNTTQHIAGRYLGACTGR